MTFFSKRGDVISYLIVSSMYLPHFAALEIPRDYVSMFSLSFLLPRRKPGGRETHLDSFIIIIACDPFYRIVLLLLYL